MCDKKDSAKPRAKRNPTEQAPRAALTSTSAVDSEGSPLTLEMFVKALDGLKQDIYDTLGSKIDSFSSTLRSEMTLFKEELKSSVATLQTTVDSHGSTIKDLELLAITCSDDLANLSGTVNLLKGEINILKAKCDDLEGRSRRNNVRLVGLPEGLEGQRPRELISTLLQDLLHLDEAPFLDRAHRSLRQRPKEGAPPRPIIIRVHYFHVRDQILRRVGETSPLLHLGKRLSIFPDFSPSVAKKRLEFVDAKRLLHTCPGVKFGLYYPAELRVTLPGGALRKFTDPALAMDFINRDLKKSVSPDPE